MTHTNTDLASLFARVIDDTEQHGGRGIRNEVVSEMIRRSPDLTLGEVFDAVQELEAVGATQEQIDIAMDMYELLG